MLMIISIIIVFSILGLLMYIFREDEFKRYDSFYQGLKRAMNDILSDIKDNESRKVISSGIILENSGKGVLTLLVKPKEKISGSPAYIKF